MKENIENKSFMTEGMQVKREGDHLIIEGYAARYGNIDSYGDVIVNGAFDKFLATPDAKRVKFCAQHDMRDVIGVIQDLKSDGTGLFFKVQICNTSLGKDYATLIEEGAINEFSIGYRTVKYNMDEEKDIRYLTELYLYEFSIVSRAANDQAILTGTERKEERAPEDIEKMSDEDLTKEMAKAEKIAQSLRAEYDKRVISKIKL